MAQPTSVSLSKLTAAVQAAVKAAVAKNPKFNIPDPQGISVSYSIRGITLDESLVSRLTLSETQAFADDMAAHLATAQPEVLLRTSSGSGGKPQGAILSVGRHVVCGIPPVTDPMLIEK